MTNTTFKAALVFAAATVIASLSGTNNADAAGMASLAAPAIEQAADNAETLKTEVGFKRRRNVRRSRRGHFSIHVGGYGHGYRPCYRYCGYGYGYGYRPHVSIYFGHRGRHLNLRKRNRRNFRR